MRTPSLEVLAFLPVPLQSHLRVVLGASAGHTLTAMDRWEPFAEAVRAATADVVVIDPCADGTSRAPQLAALLDAQPATPVVIYTPVSPLTFQAISDLAQHSTHHAAQHVVLHRYDDEPRRFLELIENQPGNALSLALLDRLGPAMAALPPGLTRAVERLVRRPTEFRGVGELATAARITVRTAYRHLAGAGFSSPRALVVGARLLRAYAFARDPRLSLEVIAAKVGYSAPRMLTKHMREVVGVTPRAVRRQIRPSEFVDVVAQWLYPMPIPTALLAAGRGVVLDTAEGWDIDARSDAERLVGDTIVREHPADVAQPSADRPRGPATRHAPRARLP
jgi:AraC-like DNA-binding protein